MTLIDSADDIAAVLCAVATDVDVDVSHHEARDTVGVSLWEAFGRWLPDHQIDWAVAQFRERYLRDYLPSTRPLPGAAQALSVVAGLGMRSLVVTAKQRPQARIALAAAHLDVDLVVGDLVGVAKAAALDEHRVCAYVGDHVGDMHAAVRAGVPGLGVAHSPRSAELLAEAGAAAVFDSALAAVEWFADSSAYGVRV